jgi:uncharacterized protein DUF4136
MYRSISKLVAVATLMLSSAASAQTVTYDYDRSTDFSRLKTYAWTAGTNLQDELNHKRIMDAVDAQLRAKGFSRVEASGNPDVLVAYHASFSRDLEISGWGGYRWGPGARSARVEQVVVGTLVVSMVNAKTRTIVWRGIASKDLDPDASPEKRDKNINKAAEKLFKNYPHKA